MIATPSSSVGCTCFALRKLTRTVTRLYDQYMAQDGLKVTQYSVMRWAAYEPLPVAELAARLSVERTTLTRNLKPLIDAGWIALLPGTDARQKLVNITPAGVDKLRAARTSWRAAQQAVQDTLGLETLQDLHLQLDHALVELSPLVDPVTSSEE